METAAIREQFLSFFEERGHRRMPSASLVPPTYDPSVLLTTAGMQPFKPYFRGEEEPPTRRLTSCQKCFRTPDIEEVGTTARHLTFFEMLGNFSVGDYFKDQAVRYALELLDRGLRAGRRRTSGSRSSAATRSSASAPTRRRSSTGAPWASPTSASSSSGAPTTSGRPARPAPAGPCSELYLDRGVEFGGPDDRPGDDTDRFLEFWNLVFMQFELHADGSLTDLPAKNIDTGLGLERMAAILQDVPSVFDTDGFRPLVALGEELSGHTLRRELRRHPRAADPVRPRPRRGVHDGRRRRALQRGPRLRAAPDHAAGDPAGQGAGHRRPVPARAVRARDRDRGGRLPRARRPARHDHALGALRGGRFWPHFGAGTAPAG